MICRGISVGGYMKGEYIWDIYMGEYIGDIYIYRGNISRGICKGGDHIGRNIG